MKKNHYGITSLLGLLFILLITGSKEPDIIYWDEDYKLSWNDFEGQPRYDHSTISAITSSGIVHYKGCKDGQIIFKIRAYFEKQESWVKPEALTDHHLTHEQIHFDITELYARKLRKALTDRKFKCGEEVEFENFVNAFTNNWEHEQKAYDIFSKHSVDKEVQKEWFYKIAMELSLLDDYRDTE